MGMGYPSLFITADNAELNSAVLDAGYMDLKPQAAIFF
jgi:hypothetical protein